MHLKRREFLAAASVWAFAGAAPAPARTQAAPEGATIQQVIDGILAAVPAVSVPDTVDTVKCGDPGQKVTGIVTTFLATCEVIEKTRALGANLLIPHEPLYYNHRDDIEWLEGDATYQYKRRLLADSGIVVWRFHDYWHRLRPDPVTAALLADLGLQGAAAEPEKNEVQVDPAPLRELALSFKKRLGLPWVRIIGDPAQVCRRIGILPGAWGREPQIEMLRRPHVDALVCGEINEWETNIYVRDAISAGRKTALIVLGHVQSEEPGMRELVPWLKSRFPEIPVAHVPTGDLFAYL